MTVERTLSIIKPDAVAKNVIGAIISRFEGANLKVIAAEMVHLTQERAEAFYAVHKDRPFFNDLVKFMISGPVFVQVLMCCANYLQYYYDSLTRLLFRRLSCSTCSCTQ